MDFIRDNYLWIILLIIVVLMAIVGYIAEKNDFIKQSVKVDRPKKVKETKKQKEEPIIIEDKGIDELLKNNIKKQKEERTIETVQSVELNDDIMAPLVSDSNNLNDSAIDQSLFAPLESTEINNDVENNELNPIEVTQLQDIDTNIESEVVNADEDIWKF